MSKAGKRAKSGVQPAGGTKWENGLNAAVFEEVIVNVIAIKNRSAMMLFTECKKNTKFSTNVKLKGLLKVENKTNKNTKSVHLISDCDCECPSL